MTNAPEKIYLHDPHGYFDDDHGGDNTVLWSEDMIDDNDIEYIRADVVKKLMEDIADV